MKIDDSELEKIYLSYRTTVDGLHDKFKFSFEGYILCVIPEICLDSSLKWHIYAKKPDESDFRLVGGCLVLFDVSALISKKYLDDVFEIKRK